MSRRRFLVPEVIQTSAMDCGPAALKCLLAGFSIHVSYGRLREACQTDVDGTSINVLEDLAAALGLDAWQTMVPLDHLFAAGAESLPAIVVIRNPDGNVHFVVVWRRVGPLVQVMDPASGRRWLYTDDLLARTFEHVTDVAADGWREWAGTSEFTVPLRSRLRRLGIPDDARLLAAVSDVSWRSLAVLDAAVRLTDSLVDTGGVKRGPEAERFLRATFEQAMAEVSSGARDLCIPPEFWSAAPATPADDGTTRVRLRGAVLLRARGLSAGVARSSPTTLSPEVAAALEEPPSRPLKDLVRMLREDGLLSPAVVASAAMAAAVVGALEGLVLRGLIGAAPHLVRASQRGMAMLGVAAFFALALGLELPIVAQGLRMGRRLELRLRAAFFAKLPRLSERYFASRPTSDMSHRAHAIHAVRSLPTLGVRLVRGVAQVFVYAAGLIWIDRWSWPLVLVAAAACLVLPIAAQRRLTERDRRLLAFDGALSRFYLDALLGLVPIRAHGAGRSIRRGHETLLGELRRAFLELLAVSTTVDALLMFVSTAVAFALLAHYMLRGGSPAGSLLFVYWALALPAVGERLAHAMLQYPEMRNMTERLIEPLGALEDGAGHVAASDAPPGAAELRIAGVDVHAGGKAILEGLDLHVRPGSHVAVVGLSGAGKSSLCGLLLGFHRPSRGDVLVDGEPLRGAKLQALRRATAWVDPAVYLWNRPLLDNVMYGGGEVGADPLPCMRAADVLGLLEQLPNGLQTHLGEAGALVSGGEGQRIRLARAMRHSGSRLVILDEPFRGLERQRRLELMRRARALWKGVTLLCVTHDLRATLDFERVVVIHERRIVEDGDPRELAHREGSHYADLLRAESHVSDEVWRGDEWRRVELRAGLASETRGEEIP